MAGCKDEGFCLKEELIKIQLALKNNDLDEAIKLYEKIEKFWESYAKRLSPEEVQASLRLVDYIEKLLKEKNERSVEKRKFLNLRKSYTQF